MRRLLAAAMLSALMGLPGVTSAQAAPDATTSAALHGALWPADANPTWHLSRQGAAATFVGDAAQAQPTLTLAKAALRGRSLRLAIQSDARRLRIAAGDRRFDLALEPDQLQAITLDGQADPPQILLGKHEQFRVRGAWTGVLTRTGDEPVTLTLVDGTYANLTWQPALTQDAADAPARHASPVDAAPQGTPSAGVSSSGASSSPLRRPAPLPGSQPSAVTPSADVPSTGATTLDGVTTVPAAPQASTEHPLMRHTAAPARQPQHRIVEPEDAALFRFDAGVDFLSGYFYRGMGRSQGRLVVQPWADVDLRLLGGTAYEESPIQGVHLTFGFRSSHLWGSPRILNTQDERWFDFNWRGGVAVAFLDRWLAGVEYQNIENIRTSYRDVHQVNAYLKYDDRDPQFDWSLQPYVMVSAEYEKQSDGGFLSQANAGDRRFHRGVYLEAGVRPTFKLFEIRQEPVTLAVPVTLGLSLNDYFEDTRGRDSVFGYVDAGVELAVPLFGLGTDGGRRVGWSLELGVHTLFLGSTLQDLNQAMGVGDDPVQFLGRVGVRMTY